MLRMPICVSDSTWAMGLDVTEGKAVREPQVVHERLIIQVSVKVHDVHGFTERPHHRVCHRVIATDYDRHGAALEDA